MERVAQLVRPVPGVEQEVLGIITATEPMLEGHFAFRDSNHCTSILRFSHVGRDRPQIDSVAKLLVRIAGASFMKGTPRKIFAPASAGMFLANALARECRQDVSEVVSAKIDFLERRPVRRWLLKGEINAGDRVVVVNDVDRTGESLERLIGAVRSAGAMIEAVLLFGVCHPAEHAQRMKALGVQSHYLAEVNLSATSKGDCSLCRHGDTEIEPVSLIV